MKDFYNPELQTKIEAAKKISEDHLKTLDKVSSDIKNLEEFLQGSGFGEFTKGYKTEDDKNLILWWNGKRLCLETVNLIETKIKSRLEAYRFLPDFLESISLMHSRLGDCDCTICDTLGGKQ